MQHEPESNKRPLAPPPRFYDSPIVVGLRPYAQFCRSIDHQLADLEAKWAHLRVGVSQSKATREARSSSAPSPAD